jgi:lipopolysaccharide/colanic/teichoic acid biosynthesis glycosyltransferase
MASRPCDLVFAAAALVPALPVCLAAAAGIWLADGRPVLYKSRRVGRGGRVFTMYKLRTLRHAASNAGASVITGHTDARAFAFGTFLRATKIDELPQLLNVLLGDMAIVGPRPEDPAIVDAWYGPLARETLAVRPGLASPGSIYNFTHAEPELDSGALPGEDVATTYARLLLPRKLALDLVYVREASVAADLRIMLRAAWTISARIAGRRTFPDPPELTRARHIEDALRHPRPRLAGLL